MKAIHVALGFLALGNAVAHAEPSDFEFTLSGVVADKLDPRTRLIFWNPVVDPKNWAQFSIADLPITLPAEQFGRRRWHVEFMSPGEGGVLSVTLSAALFDRPRKINVKLDAPTPHIRPLFSFGDRDIMYFAGITRRMRYRDPPVWDSRRNKLVRSQPPVMRITRVADGAVLQEAPMESGCTASKWHAFIDDSVEIPNKTDLRFSVTYDSGGLFETITTTYDFTYHKGAHGD